MREVLAGETWTPTPLLPAVTTGERLGMDLWLKRDDCTPIGSFKLRGGLVSMATLGGGLPKQGVYVASAGNYGIALAMAGKRLGVAVTVVVPRGATPAKLDRIRQLGAKVVVHGDDFDTAKELARHSAATGGAAFWEDGIIPGMAHGAATIASEILDRETGWDAVVVPLGNGSLIKGVATVFKASSPDTRVVGLVPSGSPSMALALRDQPWDESAKVETYADGLGVRLPIPGIVAELKAFVDDVWMVDEAKLLPAVKSLIELEQIIAEPSAAICIAGLSDHRHELSGKKVVAIITGSLLNMDLLPGILEGTGLL